MIFQFEPAWMTGRVLVVHCLGDSSDLFKEGETLAGGDVLPDFKLDVAAIFATGAE